MKRLWPFFSALSVVPANGTGVVDDPFPQFQIVFDVVGSGSTTLRIGTYADYSDAYVSQSGDDVVHNVEIFVATNSIIPEPGTAVLVGLGLVGLAGAGRRNA